MSALHAAVLLVLLLGVAPSRAQVPDDAVPAFRSVDSTEARVQGCVTCHGGAGQGTRNGEFPRIAGKPAGYLYNQLLAFRSGQRAYAPMNYLLAWMPDDYLREMAEHYARLNPPYPPHELDPVPAPVLARGQALAQRGDAARGIPACTSCHGAGLNGMNPGIPGLVGLGPVYLAGQLTRWKTGARRAAEPDCMRRIASRLDEADIAAVSAWIARQRPAADPAPQAPDRVRMPLACGSQG